MWHTRRETNSGALRRFSFRFLLSESALPCSRSPSAGGLPLRSLEVSDTMPHSLAAPIVERPSFSRGPDGRTPYGVASYQKQIEDLKSDTSKNATMAKTATRRIDAAKSYMTAAATFGQIATVRQKESEFRVKQEEARQKEETLNLQKSFKIERQRFEAEWQRRAEEVDKQCKEHERVLAEVHQIATVASEKRIAAEQEGMRFKASSDLLSLQDTEKKLSGAHEFKDASEVATRSFKLKAIEEARFDRSKASYATKPREELAARQIAEMRRCACSMAPDCARWRPMAPDCVRSIWGSAACSRRITRYASRSRARRRWPMRSSSKSTATSRRT